MTNPSVPSTSDTSSAVGAEPVPPAVPDPARRRRRRWWVLGSLAVVLVLAVAGALFVPLPYYLLQPGSVRPAQSAVEIEGAPAFDDDGELLFTTVFVDQATLATLARGQIDDAVEVRTEEEVYGPEGRDASRRVNQQRMDLSKLVATTVALDHLGIENRITADGARVLGLAEDSPSDGLLRAGDVITAVAGTPVAMPADIGTAVEARSPGEVVQVTVRRPGGDEQEPVTVDVPLGESPEEPGRPILGVSVDPDAPRIESPVRVVIDSGEVTGPSAGLAWALAVIDRLTPGSLTDDDRVAVTGEILSDGTVAPVGGTVQKVAAVKRAGVTRFLYPADTSQEEQEEMRRIAGDELELVPVATLDEAVAALAPEGVALPG